MLVTLHGWRIRARSVARALGRMALDPGRIRRLPGVRFAKLLGTGTGDTFTPSDADLTRYAALVVWDGPADPDAIDAPWRRFAVARARLDLTPIAGHGRWSGVEPFGGAPLGGVGAGADPDGMVLALTRARLRPARALTFWRAVPPVLGELTAAPGLLARFGVGEAPIGLQGTISVWRSTADLIQFAYRQPEHRAVIARTRAQRWYAEDLFARFAVRDMQGERHVWGWRAEQ